MYNNSFSKDSGTTIVKQIFMFSSNFDIQGVSQKMARSENSSLILAFICDIQSKYFQNVFCLFYGVDITGAICSDFNFVK